MEQPEEEMRAVLDLNDEGTYELYELYQALLALKADVPDTFEAFVQSATEEE